MMSVVKDKTSPKCKTRNIKKFKVPKNSFKSETTESKLIERNEFASIVHKNSCGANNWTKFAKLLQENNKSKNPNKIPLNGKAQNTTSNKVTGSKMFSTEISNKYKSRFGKIPNYNSNFNMRPKDEDVSKVDGSNAVQKVSINLNNSKAKLTKHIAMDCEMVGVEIGVNKNMLARISLVNSHGDCIYDKFVKPTEPVLDYRTRVSGVRPKDLENATDFKIVQREVADILKGRILVGHALKNDLKVLYLSHPKHSIRDTSRFRKFREGKTPALKKLAKKYLGATIQEGEHSSVQDALAAMQLYKMFKKDWESSIYKPTKKHQVKKLEKSKTPQNIKEIDDI